MREEMNEETVSGTKLVWTIGKWYLGFSVATLVTSFPFLQNMIGS